jgi:hypothetical protein
MYQLSRITPVEVFGLDKSDIVVLVVEGYEDCTKPLALVKKLFDARVITSGESLALQGGDGEKAFKNVRSYG